MALRQRQGSVTSSPVPLGGPSPRGLLAHVVASPADAGPTTSTTAALSCELPSAAQETRGILNANRTGMAPSVS